VFNPIKLSFKSIQLPKKVRNPIKAYSDKGNLLILEKKGHIEIVTNKGKHINRWKRIVRIKSSRDEQETLVSQGPPIYSNGQFFLSLENEDNVYCAAINYPKLVFAYRNLTNPDTVVVHTPEARRITVIQPPV
jgi:hypothetical protein